MTRKPPLPKEVLEIEEQVFRFKDENAQLIDENGSLKDDNEKLRSKLKAIVLYSSELQRKNDKLDSEFSQHKVAFKELTGQDWAKRVVILKDEINQLRSELLHKDNQLQELKKRVNLVLNKDDAAPHFKSFFERQTSDMLYTKKVVAEYEKRENECNKRWNDLLNENYGLKTQLNRQHETYQGVLAENDRRLAEANDQIAYSYSDPEKRKAAEFLVSQVELLKEERRALLEDNDMMNLRVGDLMLENDSLRKACSFVEIGPGADNVYGTEEQERIRKMYRRIEELEDLLTETRENSGVNRIIELEAQISALNLEIARKGELNEELQKKLQHQEKKETACFDENEALNFFSTLIKQKDDKLRAYAQKLGAKSIAQQQHEEEKQKIVYERNEEIQEKEDLKIRKERIMHIMKENEYGEK
jgi:hypothetical protein